MLLEAASPPLPLPPRENAAPPQGGAGFGCASARVGGSGPERAASTKGSNPSAAENRGFAGGKSFEQVRQEAFRLRSGQRGLVHGLHRSLSCCGLGRIVLRDEHPDDVMAGLTADYDAGRADLRGLTRCASPWACPVCAPKVAAVRARVLAPQVAARLDAGWSAWLVTLTLRHGRQDALPDLLEGLRKGWGRLTSGRWWADFRGVGTPEFIRGLDLTWSDRHGWHPHVHVVLLLPPEHVDDQAAAMSFAGRWREVLARVGFEALPGAQDVQKCRDAAAAAAYATAPAAVYEAVGIGAKTARNPRAGLTAFDLLRAAVPAEGDSDAGAVARWCEYVEAVKGRRQTTVSRGLTLDEDQVLLEQDEELQRVIDVLARLGQQAVSELDRARRVPQLLEAVEQAGPDPDAARDAVLAVLSSLRARDWFIVERQDLEPEAPSPVPEPEVVPRPRPVAAPPPLPLPSDDWESPVSEDGRVKRRVTPEDRRNLYLAQRASA